MPAKLLSVNSVDKKPNHLCIDWYINFQAGDAAQLPGFPYAPGITGGNLPWYPYVLNASQVQSQVDFGIGRALQLAINREKQYYVDGAHNNIPGRVAVQVSSSGQVFMFSARDCILLALPPTLFECENVMLPVVVANYAPITIWMEADYQAGAAVPNPQTTIYASLFNFDIPIPGLIG